MPKPLREGSKAPAFDLPIDGGGSVALRDFAGRSLVLYFYPKDDTAACTREAIDFSKLLGKFKAAGAAVVGVSKDSPQSHETFRKKHGLKVILGADETGETIKRYGAWIQKTMYGRNYMGVDRSTFLIDREGVIRRIWRKVRTAGHAADVLEAAKALM
jgi:peroxiredoxin Q/BCP